MKYSTLRQLLTELGATAVSNETFLTSVNKIPSVKVQTPQGTTLICASRRAQEKMKAGVPIKELANAPVVTLDNGRHKFTADQLPMITIAEAFGA